MGKIFLNNNGNGYTYCVPPFGIELANNESFTVYFNPDAGATLDDVRAYDSYDFPIALPAITNNSLTMTFRTSWRNMYLEVYYSGSPTPPPPPPVTHFDLVTLLLLTNKKLRKKVFKF